ncbi:MAG: hypothetical protein IIA83_00650 [Thaumarchaeota archaeon]|nr:hypothetical protein [Nitrososphaerota archaeon]
MSWKNTNPYIRFGLGVALGIGTIFGMWIGSDYKESETPEEVTVRVASILYAPAIYGVATFYIIAYGLLSTFYKKIRTAEPWFFVVGFSSSISAIGLMLMIIDPTNFPFLGDLR